MMTDRRRASAGLAGYVLVLIAALVSLHLLGSGPMAGPPLSAGLEGLQRWLGARQPAVAAFALVRVGTVVAAWYLLATTLAALVLRVAGAMRAAAVVEALSLPATRRLVHAVAGFSLAASTLSATGAMTALAGQAGASTARDAVASVAPAEDNVLMQPLPEDEVVMRRLPDNAASPPAVEKSWTVRPGDHFWRVAQEVLAAAWGRSPGDRETIVYWGQLVEVNRGRLVDRDNPDLLIPGQVLEVPTPPAAPG